MGEKTKTRMNPKTRMLIKPKQKAANVYQLYIYDEVTDRGNFNWATWEYVESETSADYFRKQLAGFCDEIAEIVQHKELEEDSDQTDPEDSETVPSGDELEENLKQYFTALFQQQTNALKAEIRQQVDPAPKKPEENKCINFLKQFMD